MDASKTFAKIIELGKNNNKREELQEYCKLKIDQIISFLPRRILNSDGAGLLDCILNGISDEPSLGTNKVKIIDVVLNTLRKESISLTHSSDIMSRVLPELLKQNVTDLVRWCDDCVQSIVEDSDTNMIWKDILPERLNAIATYNSVNHCGTDMTGAEYKQQCIRTLCQCKWKDHQLVQLTAMFIDMELSKNNHKQVVNKICSHIMGLTPTELPPLVHRLVRLCKLYHLEIVLAQLSHYFNLHLYSKLEPPPQDSESTTMDIDDLAQLSPAELSSCLSTCIYHMTQGTAEHELIKKHIKTWPKTQLLRAPFLVDIALAVSDKGAEFKSVCLDAIKSAIEQRALDELRCKQSAWVRSVLPPDVDVVSVLKVLTTESANHRELTVLGLINLAFSLLGVSRLKPVAPVLWSHGKLILVRLCKTQPATTGHILSQLADRLCGDVTQRQYSECFYILCKLTPVSVEPCTQVNLILENCQPADAEYESAALVLAAVHPLLAFSTRVRDALVMICRKGLYARDSLHRCLSVCGFLTVLRHIKLSGALPTSQGFGDQFSVQSYLTQLTVDVHATQNGAVTSRVRNEAMCMEVVSILRRCLVQDANVKQLFYTELYECVKDKPALHEAVLELLYEHLNQFLPEDEDGAVILLDDCIQITSTSAVLTEPISRLLYLVAQFLQPVEEDLEDILSSPELETASAHLKSKLNIVMDKLCSSDNIANINMEDPGLSDLTPESKAKCIKVQQVLQCHEALAAHLVMQWTPASRSAPTNLYKIYKACSELMDQTKTPSKQGKKNTKSLLNETGETAKSQKSQKTQKDKGKGVMKLSNMVKDRTGPFKPLPCLWDLKFCLRILILLYSEEVPWSSVEQRNQIRARRDFHQWALRGVMAAVAECGHTRHALTHLVKIAALLYRRCVIRFEDLCNFDEQTALGCLDVFKSCLSFILSSNYSLKLESLVPYITGLTDTTVAASIANILEHIHTALAHLEVEGTEDADATGKKILSALCQLATLLLETPLQPSPEMSRVIIKLEEYVRRSKQDWLQLLVPLLAAACREQHEAQLLDDLLEKLATALGRIDEEDSSDVEDSEIFPSIDSRTGHIALNHVCAHLGYRFKSVEHLLTRARDLASALDTAAPSHHTRIEKEVKEVYKCVVVQLCQLSVWAGGVARMRTSAAGCDRVLAVCVRLYALLATLVRHIQPELAIALRLDRLLKISGKRLSSVMDCLITYLEQVQQQQGARRGRDSRLVPRLVLEAEQFNKHATILANKAKVDYQQYFSLGIAHDFKIKASLLQQVLSAREEQNDTALTVVNTVFVGDISLTRVRVRARGSWRRFSESEGAWESNDGFSKLRLLPSFYCVCYSCQIQFLLQLTSASTQLSVYYKIDALLSLLLSLLLAVLLTLLHAVLRAVLWILSLLLRSWPPKSRSPLPIVGATAHSSFGD
ncbi:Fanconi anemia group I protein homolog [Papilio machaon]|uniref:Fanconi anemia group I protein homolog n=1 Tax=Papilio machaon TaxID=76193 RepID=UPI001E664A07|nr:Fanconi anemia group I protein homolog [Papilio machaon]